MLRDKGTLYYSVLVYRDAEGDGYVASSAFKMRYPGDYEGWPAAAGDTPQKAADNLAEAIRTLTGRKEVFPIEIRQQHDRYACMRCSVSQVHVFSDKDEAKKHTEARKAEQGWINNV